ncbi:carboxypeptidase family protein [Arcticibacter pallidicorallinus]|uniref:Carboxypeptidase family protein n=1 Tax=Arcticibacter pallidicorallinus TaxID=1259464 RepID=A0A2T0U9J6_9SPHI|nr:outer membrane beta-barrel protein [Arcticibacter pallidicorallinus]PRY54611.1 carboxypeptidase family protein [Arcticibacter pallidicorallinus]
MKLTYLIIFCVFVSTSLFGQQRHTLKGSVIDTASNVKMVNVSVSVIAARDSILIDFGRTNASGEFQLNKLKPGKAILLLTYPGYADYVEQIQIDSLKEMKDLGSLKMILKANLLAEVIVKAKAAAVKIKGDTTEFNAGSFEIQPNSRVEDLLKQFPGIQVDKDGKITAQGETVNKVLVDGEEFFGDDPTLVTKNIRADMVDKVQLYDKKSDQATFTGIDDGEKTKTLNIKLKEDKKSGYFGKVETGGGNDDFYRGQAMINVFKGKKKFAAYGLGGNDGTVSLGWEDASKYGSGTQVSADGGIYISGERSDYNGQGIPISRNGGLHYDTKWNSDKHSVNTNYKISHLEVDGNSSTITQNNLPTGIINSNAARDYTNVTFRQKVDATYEVKLDSSTTLKLIVDGGVSEMENREANVTESYRGVDTLLNTGVRRNSNEGKEEQFFASALYTKKLKKAGRTISVLASQNLRQNETSGYLNSVNEFFNRNGSQDSVQNIDQLKQNDSKNSSFRTNLTYTEPLSTVFSLVMNYGLTLSASSADRRSYNMSAGGQYNLLDTVFSNNFEVDETHHQGGAILNYKKDKATFNFGSKVSTVDFRQKDIYDGQTYSRNFINWNPQATYQYRFSQQRSLRLNYSGNTSQPSLSQIQPIRVNDDPLNIVVGNPNLKPSYRSRFDLSYNSYKVMSEQYIYLYSSYSFTSNQIVQNTTTDSAGKSVYQAVNLSDKQPSNMNLSAYYGQKVIGNVNVGLELGVSGNTYYNYVNAILNKTKSYNYSGGLRISHFKQKKYEFSLSFRPGYSTNESSLQPDVDNNGFLFNSFADFAVYLPGKFQISSSSRYEFREKTQSFNEDFERMIIDARIEKKFFKSEALRLAFRGNDLLNQNQGIDRSANNNMVIENRFNTIKRNFMISAIWDFNKMGGGVKK